MKHNVTVQYMSKCTLYKTSKVGNLETALICA